MLLYLFPYIFVFPPDMKIPIASALQNIFNIENQSKNESDHTNRNKIDSMNIYEQQYDLIGKNLAFFEPSIEEFPSLKFLDSNQYITINASNEILVQAFLDGKIKFQDITHIISDIISKFSYNTDNIQDENDILDIDNHVRKLTEDYIENI